MRLPFDRNINPYFALLVIALVGAGATLALLRVIELTDTLVTAL
jgi:hypothetical protein